MIDLKLNQVKQSFFDRKKVKDRIDRATRKVLSRFGAFVRTRAQSSMLRHPIRKGFGVKSKVANRAGVSEPGQPPLPHTGDLVRNIFFAYLPDETTVSIGPIRLNKPGLAPRILEKGGTVYARRGKAVRKLFYRPRPYMMPAFRAELDKRIPGDFRGEVKE